MARYIDADAAQELKDEQEKRGTLRDYEIGYWNALTMAQAIVLSQPTADVVEVEVVRCRDCRYYTHIIGRDDKALYGCSYMGRDVALDAFCSYGERRE